MTLFLTDRNSNTTFSIYPAGGGAGQEMAIWLTSLLTRFIIEEIVSKMHQTPQAPHPQAPVSAMHLFHQPS
jgi:hypothetical protein